jgi:hypothetical protein
MLDMLINCTSFDHYTYKNAYRFTEVDGVPSQTLIGFTIVAQHAIAATNVVNVCFISRLRTSKRLIFELLFLSQLDDCISTFCHV